MNEDSFHREFDPTIKKNPIDELEKVLHSNSLDVMVHPEGIADFILKIKSLHPTPEEYECMIERLETDVLSCLPVLEKGRIRLRGDYLDDDELNTRFERRSVPAVRNRRYDLSSIENKYAALAAMMKVIFRRCTIAWNYEEKQKNMVSDRKPVVVFDYHTFEKDMDGDEEMQVSFDFDDYFYGDTDDNGSYWNGAADIKLPVFGQTTVFTFFKEDSFTELELKRYEKMKKKENPGIEDLVIFGSADNYFVLLLMADQILYTIKESDLFR